MCENPREIPKEDNNSDEGEDGKDCVHFIRLDLVKNTKNNPKQINKTTTTKIAVIQIGERTHTQDQFILPNNLRVTKTMVKRPTKPIPPEDEVDPFAIVTFVYSPKLKS